MTAQQFINHLSEITEFRFITKNKKGLIQVFKNQPVYNPNSDKFEYKAKESLQIKEPIFKMPVFDKYLEGKEHVIEAQYF